MFALWMIAALFLPIVAAQEVATTMNFTAQGEGTSICLIGPDGIEFDFGKVAYGVTKYGYIKNRGNAACMANSVTVNPEVGTELDIQVPGLILADNPDTDYDESLGTVRLTYTPADAGVDHFDIQVTWFTARNLEVKVSDAGGGTLRVNINGKWTKNGPIGYILIPSNPGAAIPAQVNIEAYPEDTDGDSVPDFAFQGWTVDGIPATADNPMSFEMPNNDVSITASFVAVVVQ